MRLHIHGRVGSGRVGNGCRADPPLLVVGSVLFHVLSPWWWTPIASNWTYIDSTLVITFWITGIVFVAVVSFMAYCVWRFRHKPGNRAAYEPENRKLEVLLASGTAVSVAAMLVPGLSCGTSSSPCLTMPHRSRLSASSGYGVSVCRA